MKLFLIGSEGVSLADTKKTESISLGENGRGRKKTIIPIIGNEEGKNLRVKLSSNQNPVLVRGNWEERQECLAVIYANGAYQQGRRYSVPKVEGIKKIAEGYSATGIAGRAGGGETVLCIIEKDTEFELESKYDSTWFYWDGDVWKVEKPFERRARLALKEIEEGGGTWL